MASRQHIFTLSALAFLALELSAGAGEEGLRVGERREFHLSSEYPFVFQPVSYLKVAEPVAMRYGEPAIDCAHRSAPDLPIAAKVINGQKAPEPEKSAALVPEPTPIPQPKASPTPQATPSPTPQSSPAPEEASPSAAYPVPDNAPTQNAKGEADFSKAPDEVVGYFRNPYNFVPDSHRFFDPIFEPAQPQPGQGQAQAGPHSSATYIEKP